MSSQFVPVRDGRKNILRGIAQTYRVECAIILVTMLVGVICFWYVDNLWMTWWAKDFWDAVFLGIPLQHEIPAGELSHVTCLSGMGVLTQIPWMLWNLPVWLCCTFFPGAGLTMVSEPCLLWSNLFLVVCTFLAGQQLYHLAAYLTGKDDLARLAFILFIGSGSLQLSIGYSGQDEIVYILTFLLALRCFFERKRTGCLLWLAATTTLYPPILPIVAVVLLYLFDKNTFFKSAVCAVLFLMPDMLAMLLFSAAGAGEGMDIAGLIYSFMGSIFIKTYYGSVSVYLFIVLAVLLDAWLRKPDHQERANAKMLLQLTIIIFAFCSIGDIDLNFYRYFLLIPFAILCLFHTHAEDKVRRSAGMAGLALLEFARLLCGPIISGMCLNPYYIAGFLKDLHGAETAALIITKAIGVTDQAEANRHSMIKEALNAPISTVIIALMLVLLLLCSERKVELPDIKVADKLILRFYVLTPLLAYFACFALAVVIRL